MTVRKRRVTFLIYFRKRVISRKGWGWGVWEVPSEKVGSETGGNYDLWKTSMFIFMPKIYFIIHFFLEILHFKESCNLIG